MPNALVEDIMTTVVKIVNYIRAQPLHRREFRLLLDEHNNEYVDLLLRTEVQWLFRGYVLKRFSQCLPQIFTFLFEKKEFPALRACLSLNTVWVTWQILHRNLTN